MNKTNKDIYNILSTKFNEPKCELNYSSTFELLVAVILSAQCTDKRVNLVTEKLFKIYNTPESFSKLDNLELEKLIYSCGFYKNKAKNIINMSKSLIERFNGIVPSTLEELESLDGVGRKTANVMISEGFKGDAFAVDTHVLRVSNRLGFIKSNKPLEVEKALMDKFNKKDWGRLHLQMVLFGRYVCKSQKPDCNGCPFKDSCKFVKTQDI